MVTVSRLGLVGALTAVMLSAQTTLPAEAQLAGYVGSTRTSKAKTFFNNHPKVKAATIGVGVGTAAGAATGLVSGRGVVRGALVGAGTGAGVGLIRSSKTLKRHPIVRDTATGVVAGLGLGMAASRGKKTGLKGAAAGGAVGLGIGALGNVLR